MSIRTRYMAVCFAVAAPFATLAFTQTNSTNSGTIAGIWRGTATAGGHSAEVSFDIRSLSEGLALYMTLPKLHAWRMPVDFLKASPDGTWSVPDWHIVLRRSGDKLAGELGDPRVRFELSRADALHEEPRLPAYPPGPPPVWTYDAGAPLWASAVASEGVAYIGDTRGTVHAVNVSRGTRAWTADVGAPIYGAPLAAGRSLFVFDDAGVLHRLDRRTGKTVWRVDLGADSSPRVLPAASVFTFDFHSPQPALHDGTLYVASSRGVVHAISVDTGRIGWQREVKSKVRATVAVSDTRVFVATLDNDLIALDRRTGDERWRFKATGPLTSAPSIAGDLVLSASRGSWITALTTETGAQMWAHYDWFSWIESSGVLADGTYYVGSSDLRAIRAFDPRTGEVRWETDVLGWAWGTPAITHDTIYIGVAGPQKYVTKHEAGLVALDRNTGMVRWRRPVPSDPVAFVSGYPGSVALSDDMLIAPNVNGRLEGYRVRDKITGANYGIEIGPAVRTRAESLH